MARSPQLICALLVVHTSAYTSSAVQREQAEPHLDFLAVGDVGLPGSAQTNVARGMAEWASRLDAQFTINLGDNFYEYGVESKDDSLWDKEWREPFSAPSLNHTWYSILGNHDYMKNPTAQVDYHHDPTKDSRWYMPAKYYTFQRTIPGTTTTIDFFMLDTNPMAEHPEDVRNDPQYAWLEAGLAGSTADWIIVCGHHPVFSGAAHGNTPAVVKHVLPLLIRYGVALYMAGHDHVLSYITPMLNTDAPDYLISGAGSKLRPGFSNDYAVLSSCHRAQGWEVNGFAAVTVAHDTMTVRLVETSPAGNRLLRAYVKPNPRPNIRNSALKVDRLLASCPRPKQANTAAYSTGSSTGKTTGSPATMWILVIAIVFGVTGTVTSAGLYVRLRRALRALDRRKSGGVHTGIQFSSLQTNESLEMGA